VYEKGRAQLIAAKLCDGVAASLTDRAGQPGTGPEVENHLPRLKLDEIEILPGRHERLSQAGKCS
jgi:hypothetical protein